jgi:hypothetical protein
LAKLYTTRQPIPLEEAFGLIHEAGIDEVFLQPDWPGFDGSVVTPASLRALIDTRASGWIITEFTNARPCPPDLIDLVDQIRAAHHVYLVRDINQVDAAIKANGGRRIEGAVH